MGYLAIVLRAYEMLSCSWFYRFRLFMFLVFQTPALHAPGFLVPRSVPCFTDGHCWVLKPEVRHIFRLNAAMLDDPT